MALFVSTYVNKIDKKGRVSLPSSFRLSLQDQSFYGVVLFRSQHHKALEGFTWSLMQDAANQCDQADPFSDSSDDWATALFGEAVQLPIDNDGRIFMPKDLIDFAGIDGQCAFVGLGKKFQIWDPDQLEKRKLTALKKAKGGARG